MESGGGITWGDPDNGDNQKGSEEINTNNSGFGEKPRYKTRQFQISRNIWMPFSDTFHFSPKWKILPINLQSQSRTKSVFLHIDKTRYTCKMNLDIWKKERKITSSMAATRIETLKRERWHKTGQKSSVGVLLLDYNNMWMFCEWTSRYSF